MVNSRHRPAQLPWEHQYHSFRRMAQRHWPRKAQQPAFHLAAAPVPFSIAGPRLPPPGCSFVNNNFTEPMWGQYGSMQGLQQKWTSSLTQLPIQPPPPPRRKAMHKLVQAAGFVQSAKTAPQGCRMPLQAKQQHQVQQHAAQKPKHRRSAAQRRRRAVAHKKKRLSKQQQPEQVVPQSPVCPPAPFNSNEYLMDRFEQQYAAQQADNAAAAQLADAAAANLEAAAEWDLSTHQASCLELTAAADDSQFEEPEVPVCPPAPRLDNEFYMSRFEQQLKQEATFAAAAAAAAPVLDTGVAEWDPLLREVTTLQRSTASSLPAMCAFADDSSSQC